MISSTGTITGSGSIGGNATAASTISGVSVSGTTYANTVSPTPPTQVFPRITYTGIDKTWYTIHTYSRCRGKPVSSAQTFVESTLGGLTGNHLVYITGATPCTYSNSNNSTVNIPGNLMIITDWGIDISNKSTWAAATVNGSVYFLSDWRVDGNATSRMMAAGRGLEQGRLDREQHRLQLQRPGVLLLAVHRDDGNQNNFYGQVMGDPVSILNQFTMTYRPVLVPGYGTVSSFTEDIAYVREVANP